MIGMEFIQNESVHPKTKLRSVTPATDKARQFIAESLRQGWVLLSSGPAHNVISITPPLIFSEKEAELAVKAFDRIFQKLN